MDFFNFLDDFGILLQFFKKNVIIIINLQFKEKEYYEN